VEDNEDLESIGALTSLRAVNGSIEIERNAHLASIDAIGASAVFDRCASGTCPR